jgi:hypothetical protein
MGNLIAEKRVDKNGVLTTKHVRAGAKTAASKTAMPAPKLATSSKAASRSYKAPTAGQLKRVFRTFTASMENPDPQLLEALGLPPTNEVGIYRFNASANELYEMMARTSNGNALALINAGYNSVPEAMQFLSDHGLKHLEEPCPMALEAQERRIPIEKFVSAMRDATPERLAHPNFMDYMEVTGIAAFSEFSTLPGDVFHGGIRLSDMKAVGITRIGKSIGWDSTEKAFRKMADGTANYGPEDLKVVLDLFGGSSSAYIEHAMELTDRYGIDFTKTIKDPTHYLMKAEADLVEKGTDVQRIKSLLKYRDEFVNENVARMVPFSDEEMERFHDAGVSPADVIAKRITLTQLDAIEEHGISPSVSGGWL